MKKLLLILLCLPLLFTSCKKCQECIPSKTHQEYNAQNIPIPREEVCRDNFNSKSDYNNYINHMEEDLGYTCRSDFWN